MVSIKNSLLSSSLILTSVVNALTTTTAAATTSTKATCNPLTESTCPGNPALATSISVDFTEESDYFSVYYTPDQIFYTEDGLTLTLAERWDNPSLKSNFYIMFGRVEVSLKSAYGTGIISSFYLQSDDLDEIDLEWFGGDGYEVQTNYFSKGNTTTYDRGGYHAMDDPRAEFHNYTIDWTEDALTWYIDGTVIRTLLSDSSSGYPQTPMYLMMGMWAGGDPSNNQGTIEWAGGATDYNDAPFSMYINKLSVVDYSTGTEYTYGDDSGDWTSIQAVGGEVNGRKAEFSNDDDEEDDDETSLSAISSFQSSWPSSKTTSLRAGSSTGVITESEGITTSKRSTSKSNNGVSDTTLTTKKYSSSNYYYSSSGPGSSSESVSTMSNGANRGLFYGQGFTGIISFIPAALFALTLL